MGQAVNHPPFVRLRQYDANNTPMTILQQYLEANRQVESEHQQTELELETGEIPKELHGTFFRNGPGHLEHQGVLYQHLFDGDGMISAFAFEEGKVRYSNRFVRTKEFKAEEKAGRMLYRSFGTNVPGGFWRNFMRMQFKNAANTNVIYHGGKLLALWEGGLPHEIDPLSLKTIGRYDYDGVLLNDFSMVDRLVMPELPFSAHPRLHPDTGVLHNFGTATGAQQQLLLYQVSPQGEARITHRIPMKELYFTHDYVLTEQGQHIFFLIPIAFKLWQAFLGLKPPVDALQRQPDQGIKILVVDGEEVREYTADYRFIFHFANGYQREDGALIVDAFTMPDFPLSFNLHRGFAGEAVEGAAGELTRYTLQPGAERAQQESLSPYPSEFPAFRPERTGKPYSYAWGIGDHPDKDRELIHGIVKFEIEQRQTRWRDYYPWLTGEPVWVAKPGTQGEDEGWLLLLTYDPEQDRTRLHILEADNLATVAIARLPHNVPLVFHGTWVPEVFH